MSPRVDYKAQTDSIKALSVIFIILIASASLSLLIKIVARQKAVYNVRRCMVIVLTLGVLLYSLFPLVVIARTVFGDNDITCRTHVTSRTYFYFFFPFVYAFGLIIMALEIFTARNGKTPSAVVQFVYISVPWLLALLVVLPLTMTGIDYDKCKYYTFILGLQKAQIWVCCLLPPIGAVGAFLFLVFTRKSNPNDTVPSSDNTQGTTTTPAPSMVYKQATYNTASPSRVALASALPSQPQQQFGPGYYSPHDYHSGSIPPPYEASVAQNPPQQFGQFAAPHQSQPQAAPQPVSTTIAPPRDLRKETNALGLVAIVFFLCSFPHAVYTLGYSMNEDAERMDPVPEIIVNDTIYWIAVLRWFLLPICWFKCM